MTMQSTRPPGPLSSLSPVALHLLARQAVTPLSRTAFVRQPELFYEATRKYCSYPGRPTQLKPATG